MEIDPNIRKTIVSFLKAWKTKKISKAKLEQLRDELAKKKDAKSVNMSTLKKMIKRVAKETAQAEKIEEAKIESISGFRPVIVPITNQAFKNVILFDLAASKRTLQRLNEKLEDVKEESKSQNGDFKQKLSSQVSLIRKELERMNDRLVDIEKQLIQKSKK